jgi:hypothetical protein
MTEVHREGLFEPELDYHRQVVLATAALFGGVRSVRNESGMSVKRRFWKDGQNWYGAFEQRRPSIRRLFGVIPVFIGYEDPVIMLTRITDNEHLPFEKQVYRYAGGQTAALQALTDAHANPMEQFTDLTRMWIRSEEQFAELDLSRYPASEDEHGMFLAAIRSFRSGKEVQIEFL